MEQVTDFFFNQGILGIIIIVLGGVIVWYDRKVSKKESEIKELQNELNVLSDKRVEDYRQLLNTMFSSLEGIKDAENKRSEQLRELLSPILTIVQNLQNLIQIKRQ